MKLQEYVFSKETRKDTGILSFFDDLTKIINFGNYQLRVDSSVPSWSGAGGEFLLYISGNIKRLYFRDPTNSTWDYFSPIVATVSLTGQTGDITTTTLFTPTASGLYEVSVYMVCTTAGGGTLSCTIGWTDDAQAQSTSPAGNINLSVLGQATSGVVFIRSTAANITYATAIAAKTGSPQYALFIVVKQVA